MRIVRLARIREDTMEGYFPRRMESTLLDLAVQFPALVLTGPRQSGKTFLLRHLFEESHRYISLDDPDERRFALEDPRGFLEDNPPPLILDEIQQVPELLVYLKLAIDRDRDSCGQFLLTGSQTFSLMQGVAESLAGRAAILHLLPLSLSENPGRRVPPVQDRETYARWILAGTYPELHRRPDLDSRTWYASYLQTYLERDVRTLANVGNLRDFDRLLALLGARSGALLNQADLGRELGVSANTVKAWISILEASGQIYVCPAYYESLGKRVIKSPRVHLLDCGLLSRLTGTTTPEQVLRGPMAGPLFESLVGGELLRMMTNAGEPPRLYHWRTVGGNEVDFVFETGGRVHGVECKLTSSPHPGQVKSLERFMALLPRGRRGHGFLICLRDRKGRLGTARVVPLQHFRKLHRLENLLV